MNDKTILKAGTELVRNFSYSLGDMNMNFAIKIDTKQSIKNAMEIIKKFNEDLEEELKKIN